MGEDFEDRIANGYYKVNCLDFEEDAIAEVMPDLVEFFTHFQGDDIDNFARKLVRYAMTNMSPGGEYEVWAFLQELMELFY